MGGQGAVYACADGSCGIVPAKKVDVMDKMCIRDSIPQAQTHAFHRGTDKRFHSLRGVAARLLRHKRCV